MSSPSYLILDIETVPDPTLWTPPPKEPERLKVEKTPSKADQEFLALVLKTIGQERIHPSDIVKAYEIATRAEKYGGDTQQRTKDIATLEPHLPPPEEEKDGIAPAYAQCPIAIGCVWLDYNFLTKKIGIMKIAGPGLSGEKNLLASFNKFMASDSNTPNIVSWYGRGFDLPVIMLRSFKHGIPMRWYFDDKDYRYRYSEDGHLDLCDAMGDYGATRFLKLDSIAKLVGLPGKSEMDGSKVAGMFAEGRIDEIGTYCLTDVIQTAFVFLRWRYLKGRLPLPIYQEAAATLLRAIKKDELASFAEEIDETRLLMNDSETP